MELNISEPFENEAKSSGVSWPSVIGGAFVSAALSLILLALGAGLGLSSISPWSNSGASAAAIGGAAIIWLIAMQIISSAMGGYTAGRLRTRWSSIHFDEVHFRDTAHGLLTWCLGLVITVYFLSSAATSMVGGAAASQAEGPVVNSYFVDLLFRSPSNPPLYNPAMNTEAVRILGNALFRNDLPRADRDYLSQLVTSRTGLNQIDAEKRVLDVIAGAKQSAETARKIAAHSLLWVFIALLIGAFCASYAATIGGRQRDHVKSI